MKKNSSKIINFLFAFALITAPCFAADNVISSVIISKSKDKAHAYELNIDSTEPVQYKTHIEEDGQIYFDLKNSTLAKNAGTVYDDVSDIDNVVVKQLDKNKVRIYVQGENVKDTQLVFINSLFDTTVAQNSKKVIINRPINEYQPVNYQDDLENQEDIQGWDDNSFNFSHLGASLLSSLKEGIGGVVLIIISLITIIAMVIKSLTSKLSNENEPLIGLNNSKYLDNNYNIGLNKKPQPKQEELESISHRNETIKMAQLELTKAHQKYQAYLQNKYKDNIPKKQINIDAVTKSIGLNQYQKSNQNPYPNQEVIKMGNEIKGNFQIPPRPKMAPKKDFTSPYIQRTKPKENNSSKVQKNAGNMKFLESVTKIYEQSGRSDLAVGLKNSISKAKQSI